MARPSKALAKFIDLYVNGPDHLRGQWDMSANAAGMKAVPSRDDVMVQRMVTEAGGGIIPKADPLPPQVQSTEALEAVLSGGFEGIPWKQLKSELTAIIKSIASGQTQARASQIQAIRLIIEKAEAESKDDAVVHSVIVLPTQGSGADMEIDAEWMRRIMAMEVPDE